MLDYYEQMKLVKVLGASINQGKAVRPAIFCGVLEGPTSVDLHFKFCKYRQSYIRDCFKDSESFLLEM
jgi:hypothetical protein